MIVKSNGIVAVRLREKDIELVRTWRNSSFNLKYMNYQKQICKNMQKKWFRRIDNFNNFYFIIVRKGINTGVANIKNIDWYTKTGEVGVLVSDQKFIGDSTNLLVALTMCDFCFKVLGINSVTSTVRKDNWRANKFNKALGFKILKNHDTSENILYSVTKEMFYSSTKRYFMYWKPMEQAEKNMTITFDTYDQNSGITNKMKNLLEQTGKKYLQIDKKGLITVSLINGYKQSQQELYNYNSP